MKILMILETEFPPDVRVENEMLALSEAGHEVHLACFTHKNRPEKREPREIGYSQEGYSSIYI